MKILVTGGTGFTGERVLPLLEGKGEVRCFVRPDSNVQRISGLGYELACGDLGDSISLRKAMSGCDQLVNIASLGFGHAPGIVKTAEDAGIERGVFVSTTALFTTLNAASKTVRKEAEDCIRASGLDWTILRPTMIYGSSRDRNMSRLIRYLLHWPVIPVFGKGERLQQPVYVDDVARAVVEALSTTRTVGKTYDIPGGRAITFNDLIDTVCRLLKRRVAKIHLPVSPVVSILNGLERFGLPTPIKAEQVLRLNEDKSFDFKEAHRDFGFRPRPFEEGIRLELKEMKLIQ